MELIAQLIELHEQVCSVSNKRRWGVHPINQLRREHGFFDNLCKEMSLNDDETFFNFTRMTTAQFDNLLGMIQPIIQKFSNNAIPPTCRLLLTLR